MAHVEILRGSCGTWVAWIALGWSAIANAAAADSNPEPDEPEAQDDALTTREWREPDAPNDLGWEFLRLPELASRLALSPLLPFVALAEDVRLDRRIIDLLTNDERTSLLLPIVIVLGHDGAGAGLSYRHVDLFGGGEELALRGVVKENLDHELSASYADRVTSLESRAARVELAHELDRNERFFGLGGESAESDETALSVRTELVRLTIETFALHSRGLGGRWGGEARVGTERQRLEPGDDDELRPLGGSLPPLPPAGFEHTAYHLEAGATLFFDSRDTRGATSRGVVVAVQADGFRDASGAPLSALKLAPHGAAFVPLGAGRTLVFVLGGAHAEPLDRAHAVPLPALVQLGRTTYLRGYPKHRFRDASGWWSSLEYRYPVLEYGSADIGIDATLFGDLGRVGSSPEDTLGDPIRHSYGFGVRAHTSEAFVLRLLVGFSPEGTELGFSLNEEL